MAKRGIFLIFATIVYGDFDGQIESPLPKKRLIQMLMLMTGT